MSIKRRMADVRRAMVIAGGRPDVSDEHAIATLERVSDAQVREVTEAIIEAGGERAADYVFAIVDPEEARDPAYRAGLFIGSRPGDVRMAYGLRTRLVQYMREHRIAPDDRGDDREPFDYRPTQEALDEFTRRHSMREDT